MIDKAPEPDHEFFKSDPHAVEVRQVCLLGVAAYWTILGGGQEATGDLLDASARLQQLGVVARMHVVADGDPDEAARVRHIMSTPSVAAEFIGGQFLELCTRGQILGPPDPSLFAEHDELQGVLPGASLVDISRSPQLYEYARQSWVLTQIEAGLDGEAEVTAMLPQGRVTMPILFG